MPRRAISYRIAVGGPFSLTPLVRGRHFGELSRRPSRSVIEIGLLPTYTIPQMVRLAPRLIYALGSFSGVEGGVRIEFVM